MRWTTRPSRTPGSGPKTTHSPGPYAPTSTRTPLGALRIAPLAAVAVDTHQDCPRLWAAERPFPRASSSAGLAVRFESKTEGHCQMDAGLGQPEGSDVVKARGCHGLLIRGRGRLRG